MRFLTAGESHGPGLAVVIDDFPAGVPVDFSFINNELSRRQQGYGRGPRQKIETDQAEPKGGVRFGKTTGAPVSLWIENRDFKNWTDVMAAEGEAGEAETKKFTRPRPGHADLAGFYKYGQRDLRDSLERASARETAARVAAGAIAKCLLLELGIRLTSHVVMLGGLKVPKEELPADFDVIARRAESSDLRCAGSRETQDRIKALIDEAMKEGTTLGGEIEVIADGVPPGLGSFAQWDRKLDGRLAQAVMSVQAVKSVSVGAGALAGQVKGHDFHDEIMPGTEPGTIGRASNRAGGLEGGVTNGMPVVVRAVMKPISTMRTPLQSVNLETGAPEAAHFERSDVTAVPACAVICEAMTAIVLVQAVLDKFGKDSLADIRAALEIYKSRLKPEPV